LIFAAGARIFRDISPPQLKTFGGASVQRPGTTRIVRHTTLISAVLCLLLLVALPAAYLSFLLNYRSTPVQQWALISALGVGAVALFLGWAGLTPAQRVMRAMIVGGCLLVAGAAMWNFIVRDFAERRWPAEMERGAFRTARLSHHWPMYGRYAQTELWRWLVVIGASLVALWRLVDGCVRQRPLRVGALTELALLCALLTCAFAFSENRFAQEVHFRTFRTDLPLYEGGPRDLLRTYVAKMPRMHTFNGHYPPGFLLTFWFEDHLGLWGAVAALSVALTSLSVFPLAGILRELGAPQSAAWTAAALMITSAGVLIYPTLTPTPALLLPGLGAVWLLLRGLRTGSWAAAMGLGAAMSLYTFYSFAVVIVVLYLVVIAAGAVVVRAASIRRVFAQVGTAVAVLALLFLTLRITTGFDLARCFVEGSREVTRSMGTAFDSWDRYLLRGSGSVLAYLLSAGIPLAVLGLTPRAREASPGNALTKPVVVAPALAMLLTVLLGLGHLETERIWLFFTPALAITAACELHRRAGEDQRLVAMVLFLSLLWAGAQELCYRHY
jgi:hypothetical protein